MSHAPQADFSSKNTQLGPASFAARNAAVLGVIAILAGVYLGKSGAFNTDTRTFWKMYLVAFLFGLTICLGGLFFVIIQFLTRAGWSVAVRRPAEALASNLKWIWLLFMPILWMFFDGTAGMLFPWADLATMEANDPSMAHLVAKKAAYLNANFFIIRAVAYFAIWALLAWFFTSNSTKQDQDGAMHRTLSMQKWSGPAAILFALSISFAAVDWVMSLSPAWFSTMFGVYFFCGCVTGGYASLALITVRLKRHGLLQGIVSGEHLQDLGKLLFAFGMVFWAYIGFSQYMLIWYANLPEETGWFLTRQVGGWLPVTLILLFGHFVLPFVAMISRWPKRYGVSLAVGAAWMLCMHWIDVYWLVMPEIPNDIGTFATYDDLVATYGTQANGLDNPLNYILTVGVALLVFAGTAAYLRGRSLVPTRDPRLHESLSFENA
ncbi:MAG: quinol:cytochrome C oxidoreductase [Planctomycetota bacterium]|nr:MAG: quinol:cytochrome C oxidoreductase [Planctomycetota bacterium]RLS91915.1 MAG: quinol:cytochrome C oxidoreductase [Planctomycetota bacterium]